MTELKRELRDRDRDTVLCWANAQGADFVRQFAGNTLRYPVTAEQLSDHPGDTWSILRDGAFVGLIQLLRREDGNAHFGRFLVDPALTGQGIGEAALKLFCDAISREGFRTVTLSVFRFNTPAIRCYTRCGFTVSETHEDGAWSYYRMIRVLKP